MRSANDEMGKTGKTKALTIILSVFSAGIAAAQPQSAGGADSLPVQLRDTVPASFVPSSLSSRDTVTVSPALSSRDTVAVSMPATPMRLAVPVLEAAAALTDTERLALADSLHSAYQFRRAIQLCDEILSESADSLVKVYAAELLANAESGFDFSSSVAAPTVIARQKFPLRDFFLYYPFPDRVWHELGSSSGLRDSLQTASAPKILGRLPDIAYFQEDDDVIYFHSPDTLGHMKIYSSLKDTLWSRPRQVFAPKDSISVLTDSTVVAQMSRDSANFPTTLRDSAEAYPVSEEIFPVLSADRRSLYFSAKRGDGAGGYDLYESAWNESDKCWPEPVNLGFPYSSVDNDYLYMNTDDGRYTVFASDRGCTGDSLYVYVLEYEFAPQRQRITDAEKLRRIMELVPSDGTDVVDAGSAVGGGIPENADTKLYMEKMADVRRLRDILDGTNRKLDEMREEFALSDDVERRQELTSRILETESEIPQIQASLDTAAAEVQKIEMEFLFKGVVIDYNILSSEASRNLVGDSSRYVFKERQPGGPLRFSVAAPPVSPSSSFSPSDAHSVSAPPPSEAAGR